MIVRAKLKNYRMSARKVRLVADLVRGKMFDEAMLILQFTNKKATEALSKLLKSASANAKNNYNLDTSILFVKEIKVDEASTYKRWKPRAMGRATPIRKRGCNISVVLSENGKVKKNESSKKVEEKTEKTVKSSIKKTSVKKDKAEEEKSIK